MSDHEHKTVNTGRKTAIFIGKITGYGSGGRRSVSTKVPPFWYKLSRNRIRRWVVFGV